MMSDSYAEGKVFYSVGNCIPKIRGKPEKTGSGARSIRKRTKSDRLFCQARFPKLFRDDPGERPRALTGRVGVVCFGFGVQKQALAAFFARFLCHFVTGAWIWGVWMPEEFMSMPMTNPWVYSALYNGWYMLAELLVTELVVVLLYLPLGGYFHGEDLKEKG